MTKGRLEAFSDGVIAILITIMVLELKVPHGTDWEALRPLVPVFLSYVLSFIYVGIYWNNHHHMLHAADHVNGAILWANLHLLFWLSLFPFVTGWMGENHFASLPDGALRRGAADGGHRLLHFAERASSPTKVRARCWRRRLATIWKGKLSPLLYAAAIPLAFVNRWISTAIYVFVALMWLVPDRRIESKVNHSSGPLTVMPPNRADCRCSSSTKSWNEGPFANRSSRRAS